MVMSASSARRVSCLRRSLRRLSENCVTGSDSTFAFSFADTTFRAAGSDAAGAAAEATAAGRCVGIAEAKAER